jgi:hypothetical protein
LLLLPQAASIRVMATLQPAAENFLRVMSEIRRGLKADKVASHCYALVTI